MEIILWNDLKLRKYHGLYLGSIILKILARLIRTYNFFILVLYCYESDNDSLEQWKIKDNPQGNFKIESMKTILLELKKKVYLKIIWINLS